jgi:hypothetical protein
MSSIDFLREDIIDSIQNMTFKFGSIHDITYDEDDKEFIIIVKTEKFGYINEIEKELKEKFPNENFLVKKFIPESDSDDD